VSGPQITQIWRAPCVPGLGRQVAVFRRIACL